MKYGRVLLALLLGTILLFSGCITMGFYQKVGRDGSSEITQTIDVSGLISTIAAMPGGNVSEETLKQNLSSSCAEVIKKDPSIACEVKDYSVVVSKVFTPETGHYEFEVRDEILYTTYSIKIDKLPMIVEEEELGKGGMPMTGPSKLTDPANKATVPMMRMSGVKMTYTIEMPASITKAEGGEIDGNKVEFDLLERMENAEPIEIEAQELNVMWLAIGGVGVIIVLVIIIFVVASIFKKKEEPPILKKEGPTGPPPTM